MRPYCAHFDHRLPPVLPAPTKRMVANLERMGVTFTHLPHTGASGFMASSAPRSTDASVTALPTLAPYPADLHEIIVAIRAMVARQKLGSERAIAVALNVKRHQLRRALSAMRANG